MITIILTSVIIGALFLGRDDVIRRSREEYSNYKPEEKMKKVELLEKGSLNLEGESKNIVFLEEEKLLGLLSQYVVPKVLNEVKEEIKKIYR